MGVLLSGSRFVVGHDEVDGGDVREQEDAERDGQQRADDLRHDEAGHRLGRDAGEGVGERAADGDRRVGEARRRREPVRGGDVAADRERRARRAARRARRRG